MNSIEDLNARFRIPGIAEILPGRGGLPKVKITIPTASAEIYLHGAQLTSWQPAGVEEVIFLSQQSRWEAGRAIRGGIPVCFPWFRAKAGNPQAPAHGVVRTKAWELQSIERHSDAVTVTLATASDEATRKWWPFDFRAEHRITVGAELRLDLTVTNPGPTPFTFEEALHTYHRVADAARVSVAGLDGGTYLDNMDNNREKLQRGDLVFDRATDNAYLDTEQPLELIDPVLHRRIRTTKGNSRTTVAWNPWEQGAKALADLGDEEWRQMACVEASNIRSAAVTLNPGAEHTMTATITVTK